MCCGQYVWTNITTTSRTPFIYTTSLFASVCPCACVGVHSGMCNGTDPKGIHPGKLGWSLIYPQTLPCSPLASLSMCPFYPESPALLLSFFPLSTFSSQPCLPACSSNKGFASYSWGFEFLSVFLNILWMVTHFSTHHCFVHVSWWSIVLAWSWTNHTQGLALDRHGICQTRVLFWVKYTKS